MVVEKLDVLEKTGDEAVEKFEDIFERLSVVIDLVQASSLEPFYFRFKQTQCNLFGNPHFGTKIISFRYTFISFVGETKC
jgi:hypothetical protein